ncbi:permease prefix domain 1-containing protein [Streptomyces sp. NPDC048172]|uniref:permease prefix domain 1-containing protein n=1 Tax=Streptomyces sp. NPDC048172 TaxID=3365505 RepID=UPI0037126714
MTQAAVLRRYEKSLAARLVGPRARRREIVDEVLDGLRCATECHLDDTSDPEEAARRAVQEWGEPALLAREFNDATLRLSAGRLAWRALCALPLLAFTWAYALLSGPPGPWGYRPPVVMGGLGVIAFGIVLCLAGAVSGLRGGRGLRAAASRRGETLASGTLAALGGVLCVVAALTVMLFHRGVGHPESLNWALVSVPATLTAGSAAYFGLSLKRFAAVARHA